MYQSVLSFMAHYSNIKFIQTNFHEILNQGVCIETGKLSPKKFKNGKSASIKGNTCTHSTIE
jgi:hypothetical protein